MVESSLSVTHPVVCLTQSENNSLVIFKKHEPLRVVLHSFLVFSLAVEALAELH